MLNLMFECEYDQLRMSGWSDSERVASGDPSILVFTFFNTMLSRHMLV